MADDAGGVSSTMRSKSEATPMSASIAITLVSARECREICW
jgi:hypothetical protein